MASVEHKVPTAEEVRNTEEYNMTFHNPNRTIAMDAASKIRALRWQIVSVGDKYDVEVKRLTAVKREHRDLYMKEMDAFYAARGDPPIEMEDK